MLTAHIIRIDQILTDVEFSSCLKHVSVERQNQTANLRSLADKQRSVLGELLARTVIPRQLKIHADNISITKNEFGKPILRDYPNLHYNISHSGDYVVCAVSDRPVGIDIEQIARSDSIKISNRIFHDTEKRYVKSFYSEEAQAIAFTEIWTKKEAYIKRDGRGLAIPLTSFSVFDLPELKFLCVLKNHEIVCHICSVLPFIEDVTIHTASSFLAQCVLL
jgi:4'-phosphopantetheinyl transferase